ALVLLLLLVLGLLHRRLGLLRRRPRLGQRLLRRRRSAHLLRQALHGLRQLTGLLLQLLLLFLLGGGLLAPRRHRLLDRLAEFPLLLGQFAHQLRLSQVRRLLLRPVLGLFQGAGHPLQLAGRLLLLPHRLAGVFLPQRLGGLAGGVRLEGLGL